MSQENVEVVKVAYEAFASGGLDRFMEHFTDDVVYRAAEDAPDDVGPIRGKDALRAPHAFLEIVRSHAPFEVRGAQGRTVASRSRSDGNT
jgi:ketosteroid isomerase-like protein